MDIILYISNILHLIFVFFLSVSDSERQVWREVQFHKLPIDVKPFPYLSSLVETDIVPHYHIGGTGILI